MKKIFGALLCSAALLASLCVPALAAPTLAEDVGALLGSEAQGDILPIAGQLPEKQGDFYLMVDGKYVTFPDAVPKLKDDRSFLPFVATFEQLGFAEEDMTWDGGTKTVTAAKDGLTISLTVGKKEILVSNPGEGGEPAAYEIDVAPYIEPALSRTYIPIGLIASVLDGYKVGWDGSSKTVIIEDMAAALAANTETYDLMDQYMAYARKYTQGNWKQSGQYGLELTLNGEGLPIMNYDASDALDLTFTAGGTYNALVSDGTGFQFDTDLTMDLSARINDADATEMVKMAMAQGNTGLPGLPMTIDLDMRGDMEKGTFYLRSETLGKLLAGEAVTDVPSDAWYRMDMAQMWDEMYSSLGLDWATLLEISRAQTEKPFQEVLEDVVWAMPANTSRTAAEDLAQLNAMFGDSAFVKQGSTYVNDLGKTVFGDMGQGTDVDMKMVLYTAGGKVSGMGVEMSAGASAEGTAALTMGLSAEQRSGKMQMDLDLRFGTGEEGNQFSLSLTMDLDGTLTASRTAAETEPPAGAPLLDLPVSPAAADMGVIGGPDGPTATLTAPLN